MTFAAPPLTAFDASLSRAPLGEAVFDPAPFLRAQASGKSRLELLVRGAKCAGCLAKIEREIARVPGVVEARFNLSTGKLAIAYAGAAERAIAIPLRLRELGFDSGPYDPTEAEIEDRREARELLIALAVAGFASGNIMLLSIPVWAGGDGSMGDGARTLFHWISGLIALPAALFAGRPFFRSAWQALSRGGANMDVPISLGVLLALGVSILETAQGGAHAFFDAAVMLLFFLLIGRYLDRRARNRSRSAARTLLALQAREARVLGPDGAVQVVRVSDIAPGALVLVAAGDRLPVDGEIVAGESALDLSLLTGESAPAPIGVGMRAQAGALNLDGVLTLRAERAAAQSTLADLARLIEIGAQNRSRYVEMAAKAARAYVPIVHSLAALTFLAWWAFGGELRPALLAAASLLIITCPCALGLAAPAVQVAASTALFARGVLVKSPTALERLAEIDHIVFDKTGVLTQGKAVLQNIAAIDPRVLQEAAALATLSRHPLARAVAGFAVAGFVVTEAREIAGQGVQARLDGVEARLGRASFVGAAPQHAETEMWFRKGEEAPQRFTFKDSLRADARETIAALCAEGFEIDIVSGDAQAPVMEVAEQLLIGRAIAEAKPGDKVARLEALRAAGRKVLMVGDGLNDAPALAAAHASMAPGAASEASQNAADLVFQSADLSPILAALRTAKRAKARMRENFLLAAIYNALAAPLAMAGLVTPLIAALAMSGSSILVTLNALRVSVKKGAS